MADLDDIALAKLAREMAMNIRPPLQVFADFGITEEDYYEITKVVFYQRTLEHFLLEWNSTTGTADRLKFQGQAGLEQLLPTLIRRAMDMREPLTAANEIGKLAAKIGGIGEGKPGDKPTADRFVIQINLGADVDGKPIVEKYDKSITIDANDIAGGSVTGYEKKTIEPKSDGLSELDIALKSLMEKG